MILYIKEIKVFSCYLTIIKISIYNYQIYRKIQYQIILCFLIPTMTYFLNYLSPTPPPGGGYNIIYHVVTPFSRFAGRGQGMR
jgi:hypothetical protein